MSGVRGFVGVTDNSWYRLLADRPDLLGEVNFWRPGGGGFQALRPGEPFFFKTHAPHNRVVGGGFFGGAVRLPASEAWDLLYETRMLRASAPAARPGSPTPAGPAVETDTGQAELFRGDCAPPA